MLVRTVIVLFATLAAGAAQAQAYRWVDEDGVVHYSDRPQQGAEQIQLPHEGRRPTPAARQTASLAQPGTTPAGDEQQPSGPFKYDSIEISAPAPEETLWNLEGTLNVSIRVTPALRPEDQMRIYFDGEPRMVSGTSFQIQEVFRGVHNIQAEVVDSTGRVMARSLPNRFYVQQTSIARPH